mmetsp:Transcript_35623/g.65261  ORF Transcript_35623/g.65261 Transcript_35623/m.65261 type:complete len:313 (-) Transcript_35623:447-1385(-)
MVCRLLRTAYSAPSCIGVPRDSCRATLQLGSLSHILRANAGLCSVSVSTRTFGCTMIGGPAITKSANFSITGSKELGLSPTAHTKYFGSACHTVSYGDFFTRSKAVATESKHSLLKRMSTAPPSCVPLIMFRMPLSEPASWTSESALTYAFALAMASEVELAVGFGKIAKSCLHISLKLFMLDLNSSSFGFGFTPRSASCRAKRIAGAAMVREAIGKLPAPIIRVAQNCMEDVSRLHRNWHLYAKHLEATISPGTWPGSSPETYLARSMVIAIRAATSSSGQSERSKNFVEKMSIASWILAICLCLQSSASG